MLFGGCCFGIVIDCNNNVIYNLKDCVKIIYYYLRYLNVNFKGIDLLESYLILCRVGVNVIIVVYLD